MKTLLSFTLINMLFIGCGASLHTVATPDRDNIPDRLEQNLQFNELESKLEALRNADNEITMGRKVRIVPEIYKIFNPDNFDCGCDKKVTEKIKKLSNTGFIPKVVQNQINNNVWGYYVDDQGATALVHSFQLQSNGTFTTPVLVSMAPTINGFDTMDYLETRPGVYNNFYYSLDCSGYLTSAIEAGAGVDSNSIKASAKAAMSSNKSLVVIRGVLYSPLMQAYKNEGVFYNNKNLRLSTLQSIISKIPPTYPETTVVKIPANFLVLLASNTGTSSFNGEASASAQGGTSFIVGKINASASGRGTIARTSSFARYDTYILDENYGALPETITVKNIKDLITQVEALPDNEE